MSAKKPFGLVTGERFTGTVTRLSTSTAIPFDIIQYGVPPDFPEPNASFTIQLMDGCTDVVAPYGAIFRATGFTGFNVSEPAGDDNVYDPTQHKITFIWDFDDAAYTPVTTPNIPTAWRNLNTAYGKQVSHVWHSSGTKTVTCLAFDTAGNWARATYTVNITSADAGYASTNTIVWSKAGNFTGKPTGATECTTLEQVHTALRALATAGGNNRAYRILLRAGETWTNEFFFNLTNSIGYPGGSSYNYSNNLRGIYFGSFGSGARPIIEIKRQSGFGNIVSLPGNVTSSRQWVFSDLVFKGEWDAAKETGLQPIVADTVTLDGVLLFTRCKFEGQGKCPGERLDADVRWNIFHDCEVTSWADYGFFQDTAKNAIIGCDLHQKTDALGGINQGQRSQNGWKLGNRHGCYRSGARPYDTIFSCTSFFTNNGWSTGNGNWNTTPPTAEQPCVRFMANFVTTGSNLRRHHHVFERCSFEGSWDKVMTIGPVGQTSGGGNVEIIAKNFLMDTCLLVAGGGMTGVFIESRLTGMTIRNCYFYRHSVSPYLSGTHTEEILVEQYSNGTLTGLGPVEIYNNTIINERASSRYGSGYTPIRITGNFGGSTVANNVIRAVNRTGFEGTAFLPLSTSAISGFTCRYAGKRWNFPPVASTLDTDTNTWTAVSRREEPGNPGVLQPGDVLNGEWVLLPYPDWTGRCNGAGDALGVLNATKIASNSTQKHVVSITGVSTKGMGDSALWDQADGRVVFDFHASGIRIQNNTGSTWTSASGTIVLLLDMSDYLMPLQTTSASPANVPLATPLAGSSALGTASGLIAHFDGLNATRPGKLTNTGASVPGNASQGWIEPA